MTHMITRWAGACVAMCVAFGGRPIETTSQADRELRIEVTDFPRPLSAAVFQVERHFGRVVTYEDGSCVAPGDIVDEAAQVRRDGKMGPRVLGRRLDSISLAYTPREASVDAQVEKVLALLLAKWNGPSHSGEFRVERAVGGYHVIPVARKGVSGNTEPYTSPLDTRITIAKEERDLMETMSIVAKAISGNLGREVDVTYRMPKRLSAVRVIVGAENQVAREIVWRALQAIDPALSWQLLCEVGENSACTINIYRGGGGGQ
jgi:hypothetical protein